MCIRDSHKGLTDVLKEEPGIEITASVDGAWLQSVAGEKMDSVCQTNKNIDLVVAQNDRMAIGAYLSARQQQLEKEMLFVGIDALPGKEYGCLLYTSPILPTIPSVRICRTLLLPRCRM